MFFPMSPARQKSMCAFQNELPPLPLLEMVHVRLSLNKCPGDPPSWAEKSFSRTLVKMWEKGQRTAKQIGNQVENCSPFPLYSSVPKLTISQNKKENDS